MNDVSRIMGNYYRSERDRNDQALADILEIAIKESTYEGVVSAILERLERHWGREADEAAARV